MSALPAEEKRHEYASLKKLGLLATQELAKREGSQ